MNDFEETDSAEDMFDVEWCSIVDVVLKVVVYKDMEERLTENGPRKLIAVDMPDGTHTAFLTSSKTVITQMTKQKEGNRLPVRAMLKLVTYGGAFTGFKLFPPSSEVTEEDRLLLQRYKKTKFKH